MKHILLMMIVTLLSGSAFGQQWPSFRNDNARSGYTDVDIRPAGLSQVWKWKSELPPDPAWDGPARWDAFSEIRDLPAMRQYDAAFHPVSDGESVFFGSSSQDTLTALDLKHGGEIWSFIAGGPIRLAPTIAGDRVLFGCDDGNAYCLDRKTGKLVWKFNPSRHESAEQRRLINNDRLISYYPIRTGITVRDGLAYFGASFLPWRESYICAIDAKTGKLTTSPNSFVVRHKNATLEGSLLVAENRLIVPQGRVAPLMFDRTNGTSRGSLPGGGGVTIVLSDEGEVIRSEGGRAAKAGQVGVFQGKERVASFPRGRSIVVFGDTFYVIDGQKLFAAGRETTELRWTREVDEPLELIMADSTLFVGGRDHVTAVDAEDGNVVWSAKVDGRVFGLAIAGKRLIASTDSGAIHVFASTGNPQPPIVSPVVNQNWNSPEVPRVREKNLLHRWVFHRSSMRYADQENSDKSIVESTILKDISVRDQASTVDLKLTGNAKIARVGESEKIEAIELSDAMFPIDEQSAANLPTKAISAEAWVRIDQPQEWGGIVGCFQDDGSTEHGWLLGYRSDRFCFAVAGGDSGLTYLTANDTFKPESWNHVVGTYNGREMRLYVNGSLAGVSTTQSGPISYAEKRYFTVGSYRDSNESLPMKGALQEARIYSTALDATNVSRVFQSSMNEFELDQNAPDESSKLVNWGPVARFVRTGEIEITYGTKYKCATVVDLIAEENVNRFVVDKLVTNHKLTVTGLPHRREVQYQIRDADSDESNTSVSYALDTHFDWTPARSENPSSSLANLVDSSPNPRGLAFLIGPANEERARQLARESELNVVLVVDDESKANSIRNRFNNDKNLVYGRQLNVCSTPLNELPAACAALVISQQENEHVRRLVRPAGGILSDGSLVQWTRKPIDGAGVWSHMYGQADNSAFGGENLSNASDRQDLTTQWIGRPGPRYKTDRQNRKPSPLAAGGRLFLQGQQRMIALDSYSGTVLWSVESPTVMRWNVPHDSSNWCANENGVFVAAEDQAWFVDGKTGNVKRQFEIPATDVNSKNMSWGYIGHVQDRLLGTVVDSSAIYTRWWGKSHWFDSTGGPDTHVVAGEKLFSMNHETGEIHWQYDGLVLHPTITILDDHVYFVEDVTPAHIKGDARRISLDPDQSHELVCLDLDSGKRIWHHPIDSFAGHVSVLYLAGGGDEEHRSLVMVASEATKQEFTVQSFEPASGSRNWKRSVAWETNHHGKHISRPAIQGDLIYLRPEVLDLADGETIHRGFPAGHGCSSYTLSTNGLFSRLGETTWWDVRTQKVNRFDRIRTDCWISIVPAQGMLLSAEGGGGCSCGTWLETSLGFLPQSVVEALPDK